MNKEKEYWIAKDIINDHEKYVLAYNRAKIVVFDYEMMSIISDNIEDLELTACLSLRAYNAIIAYYSRYETKLSPLTLHDLALDYIKSGKEYWFLRFRNFGKKSYKELMDLGFNKIYKFENK